MELSEILQLKLNPEPKLRKEMLEQKPDQLLLVVGKQGVVDGWMIGDEDWGIN